MRTRNQPPVTPSSPVEWYDRFYHQLQKGFPSWYRFLLPDLSGELRPATKLAELGCGQGHLLRLLVQQRMLEEENIFAMDQSKTAVAFTSSQIPRATVVVRDLYALDCGGASFDIVLLMEVIEHLARPQEALRRVGPMLKPGGCLYLSFPNYIHLPWLLVRLLSEKLRRPNWIVLQPIDQIYNVFSVIRLVEAAGFKFEKGIGSVYGPPVLYRMEKDGMTRFLNRLGLWWLSFHPILKFRKASLPLAESAQT